MQLFLQDKMVYKNLLKTFITNKSVKINFTFQLSDSNCNQQLSRILSVMNIHNSAMHPSKRTDVEVHRRNTPTLSLSLFGSNILLITLISNTSIDIIPQMWETNRFEVLTVVTTCTLLSSGLWHCSFVGTYQCFWGMSSLHLLPWRWRQHVPLKCYYLSTKYIASHPGKQ
jgi:hypothetical protein